MHSLVARRLQDQPVGVLGPVAVLHHLPPPLQQQSLAALSLNNRRSIKMASEEVSSSRRRRRNRAVPRSVVLHQAAIRSLVGLRRASSPS